MFYRSMAKRRHIYWFMSCEEAHAVNCNFLSFRKALVDYSKKDAEIHI